MSERLDAKRRALAAGDAIAKALADGQFGGGRLLERVREVEEVAGAAREAREREAGGGYNAWGPVHDTAQRLAVTLGSYRDGKFDGVPHQNLDEQRRALAGALEDLAKS